MGENFWNRLQDLIRGKEGGMAHATLQEARGSSRTRGSVNGGTAVADEPRLSSDGSRLADGSHYGGGTLLHRVGDTVTGRSNERIEQTQAKLLSLLDSIRGHLDTNGQHNQQISASLAQLAYTLGSLPESTRLQSDTLRALMEHVSASKKKADALEGILESMRAAQDNQNATLATVATQVEAKREAEAELSSSLTHVQQAVHALGMTARQQTDMIHALSDMEQRQDSRLIDLIRKQNRRFNSLFIVTLVMAGVSITATLITAIVVLSRA